MAEIKYGPIWQIKEQIRSKKQLIQSDDDDIKRIQSRRSDNMDELAEYEKALVILEKEMP